VSASDRRATIEKQVLRKIDKARDHHAANVSPKDKVRLQRFRSDKAFYDEKFPNLTQYSMSDTSVMSATERMTAQIIKMLFGNSDIGSMKGRNAEDDKNAETMQELCNWQIEYANVGYQKFYWWVKECLYQLYSVVMVTQKREYESVEEDKIVPQGDEERFMAEALQNNVDILNAVEGVDPQTGTPITTVTVKYMKLTENFPLIENVPSEELIWTPGARTLGECELVGRRKQVTIDYLVRNIKKKQPDGTFSGMYDRAKVMELVGSGTGSTSIDDTNMDSTRNGYTNDESYDLDDPNRKVWISECFVKADINGDHKLEDCIFTVVEDGNIFIRYEENTDGFPFCIISPVFDPFKVVPDISGIDALGQWQDLLTAIIRLTVQNLALNNNPQQLCNESAFLDFNQVLDGDAFLSINTDPAQAMQPVAQVPLAGYTLQLIEMVKSWGEEASNINRYNQGMDAASLNKTATGITALINQGSQAMELIMRNIAETGMKALFMRMVYLNQKYIDQEQVVRLTNKDLKVNKDNLSGSFDYIVNAGMGAGAKETDVQNMTNVIAQMPTWIQGGIADVSGAYNAVKKYLELVGIRNVDDYIKDPQQAQKQPVDAPVSESLRIDFATLPIEVKIQILAKSGIQATPEMFATQAVVDLEENRIKEEQKSIYGAGQKVITDHLHPSSVTLGGPINGQAGTIGVGPTGQGISGGNRNRNQQGIVKNVV